jgi:hypothetical protein
MRLTMRDGTILRACIHSNTAVSMYVLPSFGGAVAGTTR